MTLSPEERRLAYVLVRVTRAASRIHLARSSPLFHVVDQAMAAAKHRANSARPGYEVFRDWCMQMIASGGEYDGVERLPRDFLPDVRVLDVCERLDERKAMEAEARRVCLAWMGDLTDTFSLSSGSYGHGRIVWEIQEGPLFFDMLVAVVDLVSGSPVRLPLAFCGRHGWFRTMHPCLPPANPEQYKTSRCDDALGMLLDTVSPKLTIISDIEDALAETHTSSLYAQIQATLESIDERRGFVVKWLDHMGSVALHRLVVIVALQNAFEDSSRTQRNWQALMALMAMGETSVTNVKQIASLASWEFMWKFRAWLEQQQHHDKSEKVETVSRLDHMRLFPEWVGEADQMSVECPSSAWSNVLEYYNSSRVAPTEE